MFFILIIVNIIFYWCNVDDVAGLNLKVCLDETKDSFTNV